MSDAPSSSRDHELVETDSDGRPSALRAFASRHLLALAILVSAVCMVRWPLISGLYTFPGTGLHLRTPE